MRRILLVACILVALVGRARAGEPDDAALIDQGLQLRRQGKPADALVLFERAHALAPSPRTAAQMGLAEASLGMWLDAEKHLDSSLAAEHDPWVRRNRTLLTQALESASRHVGRLTFKGPIGATVSVGGTPVGTLPIPAPVRVAEGVVLVAALAPGFQRVIEPISVEGGRHVTLAIEMKPIDLQLAPPPEVQSAPSPTPVERPGGSWRPWATAGLLALGGAGLAWGGIWIANDAGSRRGSLHHVREGAWIVAGTGALLAASGGVVFVLGRRSDRGMAAVAFPAGFEFAGTF